MHAFIIYHHHLNKKSQRETDKAKNYFLGHYLPWVYGIFTTLEHLLNTIMSSSTDGGGEIKFTSEEITRYYKILEEMKACEPEDEIDGMIIAIEKLTALQIDIWTRIKKNPVTYSF